MVLDIIICVGLGALIVYLIVSIIKKLKARKAEKQKAEDEQPIIVEPLDDNQSKQDENKEND